MKRGNFSRLGREAALQLAIALLYFGGGWIGLKVVVISGQVSPVWIATGVGIWALVTFGLRFVPGVVVGAFFAAWGSGAPLGFCVANALGNGAEALGAALLLTRVFGFRPQLDRARDVIALVGAALMGALVSAVVGVPALIHHGLAPLEIVDEVGAIWVLGNFMGAMLLGPVLFTARSPRIEGRGRWLELAALVAALFLLAGVVFGGLLPASRALHTQTFLLFPPVAWAALRFGPRGAAVATFAAALLAVWGTAQGRGPFAEQEVVEGVVVLQLFMAVLVISSLLLAAAFAERKRADAHSRLLAGALRDTEEGVLITSGKEGEEPTLLYVNESFARMLGVASQSLLGRPLWALDHSENEGDPSEQLRRALGARRPLELPWALRRADGGRVQTELQLSPLSEEDGETRFSLSFRDVTEKTRMKAQLVLADRMASVGLVAAGVAHEINNPLAFMLMNLQVLQRELGRSGIGALSTAQAAAALADAAYGGQRIRDIVRSLKLLSREAAQERVVVKLEVLLPLSLNLLRHEIGGRGRVETFFGPTPEVLGNEPRLGQLFLNLLMNAVQALPEGHSSPGRISVRTRTDANGWAVVEIEDGGCGIPPELLPRLFDPFFTTKPAGVGTGLGLFIGREIVREHGGEVEVESTAGQGSTFRVLLPPAPAQEAQPAALDSPALAPGGETTPPSGSRRPRVLIVDDEVRLATSMQFLLEPDHDVCATFSGAEALRRLLGGEAYDVVLCDLQMPEVTGMEVHRRLTAEMPEQVRKLVFISGGAHSDAAVTFVQTVENTVLEKPVRPEILLATVERVATASARDERDRGV